MLSKIFWHRHHLMEKVQSLWKWHCVVSSFILEQVIAVSPGLLGALAAEDPLQYSNKRQLEVPICHCVNHGVKGRVEVA